jgi:UDP-2-acetamido-2,6-beta-L-arabino-hexul-4-ose reductase
MKILITGANGFIGKNLSITLKERGYNEIYKYDIDNSENELIEFIKNADFIFHLAGVNRPSEEAEFDKSNRGLTEKICKIMKDEGKNIPVLMSSSIQADLTNAYGLSKKDAEEVLFEYGFQMDIPVYIYRLPNVFGKWCRPNYNSVVATFCHNIANDLPIKINDPNAKINLVYIDDVVNDFINKLEVTNVIKQREYYDIPRYFNINLQELADLLYEFKNSRKDLFVTNFQNDFNRFLYTTYLSYLPFEKFSYDLDMKFDNRGWLSEFIKSNQFGQIFISRTKPGITRGNHWHHTKVEKFLVIDGEAIIKFGSVYKDKTIEFKVSGDNLKVIDIPAGYSHSIKNIGNSDVITLFWSNEVFNPEYPDTYYREV